MPGSSRTSASRSVLPALGLALLLTSCTVPAEEVNPGPAGATTADEAGRADDVVIAVGSEPDTLNSVLGHARWGDGKVV